MELPRHLRTHERPEGLGSDVEGLRYEGRGPQGTGGPLSMRRCPRSACYFRRKQDRACIAPERLVAA